MCGRQARAKPAIACRRTLGTHGHASVLDNIGRLSESNDGQDEAAERIVDNCLRLRTEAWIALQMPHQGVGIEDLFMGHSSLNPGGATRQS
jgi:hypothetical protein